MLYKASLAMAASLALAASPDKPGMDPPIDRVKLTQGLMDHLSSQSATSYDWTETQWIPKGCYDMAVEYNLSPYDFSFRTVSYDDCQHSWYMCRHKDSRATWDDMIDRFGRVPIHMRSFVRHFIGAPPFGGGKVAYTTWNGDIVFGEYPGLDSLIHEVSHSLDFHALPKYKSPFSDDSLWQDNYAKDTHTPTWYGRNSWMEDFAEAGMTGVYNAVVPERFESIAPNWEQMAVYEIYFSDFIISNGTACTKRFENSPILYMNGTATSSRKVKSAAPLAEYYATDNVTLIVPKKEIEGRVAYTSQRT